MENPNEYDDEKFTEVSVDGQGGVTQFIEDLWATGARVSDITNELNNAIGNSTLSGEIEVEEASEAV